MNPVQKWQVKMTRNLDGIKSTITVDLPQDYSEMLTNLEKVDEAYHHSIFQGVAQHISSTYANAGWISEELICDIEQPE